jgi:polyhydroxyalkanoate synthesis regulator phasin
MGVTTPAQGRRGGGGSDAGRAGETPEERARGSQCHAEAKARQIAVTEIRTAVNGLLHEYAKRYARENGVSLVKRWKHNDALVKTPRCKHKALNGVTVPIDEPFTLQGADGVIYYPQYPHDGILPAGETINCQCTFEIVKVNKKQEILKSILHGLRVWKADDHKYIRREGSPGNYTYYYTEGAGQKPTAQDKEPQHSKERPSALQENIHTILHGNKEEKEKLMTKHFYLADTPQFMKQAPINLNGEYFTVGYGIIARHKGKDTDHALSETNWAELCDRITQPFAIAKHEDNFRLFVDIKVNGRFTVVGVDVKNAGRNLEINAIKTAFGYNEQRHSHEDILYRSPKATPEQSALLEGSNAHSLPSDQALTKVSSESREESSGGIEKARAVALKVNKMSKTKQEILKTILHNLQVWKRAYRVGDRRNTRGFWEVKYRNAKGAGADNWRPLGQKDLFDSKALTSQPAPKDQSPAGALKAQTRETAQEFVQEFDFAGEQVAELKETVDKITGLAEGEVKRAGAEALAEALEEKVAGYKADAPAAEEGADAHSAEPPTDEPVASATTEPPMDESPTAEESTDTPTGTAEPSVDEPSGAEEAGAMARLTTAPSAAEAAAIAATLPKTPETVQALKRAVAYFENRRGRRLELYDEDYTGEPGAFRDTFTAAQRAEIAASVEAYRVRHPNARLVWLPEGYLVDDNEKGRVKVPLVGKHKKSGEEVAIKRIMGDEAAALEYIKAHPHDVVGLYAQALTKDVVRKLFHRFQLGDMPGKQSRLNEELDKIRQHFNDGSWDTDGIDYQSTRGEITPFATSEESERDNRKRIAYVRKRWQARHGIAGEEWEVAGHKGRWRLVEADAPLPSHDPHTFKQSEGFIHNQDGRTMNDRNYEIRTNQDNVNDYATHFNGRALGFDETVVVSPDGFVLSGNNRTMSSQLAAEQGSDSEYIAALQEKAEMFGFSPEQIGRLHHPRVVFETEELHEPYSTQLFASFNEDEEKKMSERQATVKASRLISADDVQGISAAIAGYDRITDVYHDKVAVGKMFNTLLTAGVVTMADKPNIVSDAGVLTREGQLFLQNTVLAAALSENPEVLKTLGKEEMQKAKSAIARAAPALLKNAQAMRDLPGAVVLLKDALQGNKGTDARNIEDVARGGMFLAGRSAGEVKLAKLLNGNTGELNRALGGKQAEDDALAGVAEQPEETDGARFDIPKKRPAQETARVNAERIAPIREKYTKAQKFTGKQHAIYLGDKQVRGHWELLEADVPTASHDPRTFRGTPGFPEDDFGQNVNDRDYSDDYNAKNKVHAYAAHFNAKALGFDKPVVISQDGVVLSGNNRTMSSQVAAGKGSDGVYLAALGKRAQKFGFSAEQIERFKHPRVVFRPDGEIPYTVNAFAEFNAQDKKGQDEEGVSTKAIQALKAEQKAAIAHVIRTAGGLVLGADNEGYARGGGRADQAGHGVEVRSRVRALRSRVRALRSRVHALRSRVHALRSRVRALRSRVRASRSRVRALRSRVRALRSRVHALRSRVRALRSRVHALRSRVCASRSRVRASRSRVCASRS